MPADPTIKNVTVQNLPPSTPNPRRKLDHDTKFRRSPTGYSPGAFVIIAARLPFRKGRKK